MIGLQDPPKVRSVALTQPVLPLESVVISCFTINTSLGDAPFTRWVNLATKSVLKVIYNNNYYILLPFLPLYAAFPLFNLSKLEL